MQIVRPIVLRELVRRAVDAEARVTDAVRVAADDGAEPSRVGQVLRETVVAEDHVRHSAVAVRDRERGDRRAVGDDRRSEPMSIREDVSLDRNAVGRRAEEGAL